MLTPIVDLRYGGDPLPELEEQIAHGFRAYVAWHPAYPLPRDAAVSRDVIRIAGEEANREGAVLRFKTAEGLAEWHARNWRRFEGHKPYIADVTDSLREVLLERQMITCPEDRAAVRICVLPTGRLTLLRRADELPAGGKFLCSNVRASGGARMTEPAGHEGATGTRPSGPFGSKS
jgi:hypothetical protein